MVPAGSACRTAAVDRRPPIVQPGAPGEPTQAITPAAASDLSRVQYTAADVRFMQGMISHHAQALEMTALVPSRTLREEMRKLSQRIALSQEDEIGMMQTWLRVRGQEAPAAHVHEVMPGMLTAGEMDRLAGARGAEFDRLFLEGMIKHHDGALVMVKDLFASPAAAQDSEIFAFASDVDTDQRMEIERMGAMLVELQK